MSSAIPEIFSTFSNPSKAVTNHTSDTTKTSVHTEVKADSFTQINNENKNENKNIKWKILGGMAGVIVGLASAGHLIYRCKFKAIKKLAENITFTPAKTMEEAKKFAAEHLKIKKFNLGDDVGLANWVNQALTTVSNLYKGKAYLPSEIKLIEDAAGKDFAAAMSQGLNSSKMTNTLFINGEYFSRKAVNERFQSCFKMFCPKSSNGKREILTYPFLNYGTKDINAIVTALNKGNSAMVPRFTGNAISANAYSLVEYGAVLIKHPLVIIKDLYSQPGFIELVKTKTPKGTFKEISELEKMTNEQGFEYVKNLWKLLKQKVPVKDIPKSKICPANHSNFTSLFHELGHANHERRAMFKYSKMHVSYDKEDKIIGKLAKEFVESPEEQLIASTVSNYAKHSPLEFVAEVYARVLEGHKFGEDVMRLYEKYKGPKLPI